MVTELTKAEPTTSHSITITPELVEAAKEYIAAAKAPSTRHAYRRDWERFDRWCHERGITSMPAPPEAVALHLADLARGGRKPATIARALAGITEAHRAAGHASPRSAAAVRETVRGIKRTHGTAQRQVAPILVDDLRAMVGALPDNLLGVRDRALLLLGFAGAFRRSELVGLDINDIAFTRDGLEINLRRSKTDQDGHGRKIGVAFGSAPTTCPVRALKDWLDAARITSGPVLRGVDRHGHVADGPLGAQSVARVVKRATEAAGLDPSKVSGHSLRAGLATSAAKARKSERSIMRQTGHRSTAMVRKYVRIAELFEDNATTGIGL
jgi:integrase